MDKPTTIAVIAAAVTGLLSAGAFKFYEFILRQRREVEKEEKAEQALYRDDLIKRVEKLEQEKEAHVEQLIELKTLMSGMKVELDFIKRENELLKLKIDSMR
tara:strand:- start:59 stop:364 length:306 start_codon:yes stop_codon:yes gene_type:complete